MALARTTTVTYETQKVMWATEIWASEPLAEKSCAKKSSRLMPRMISGATIGSRMSVSESAPTYRVRSLASPMPSSVPRTVETTTATGRHLERVHQRLDAGPRCRSSVGYQSSVKPVHREVVLGVVEAEDDEDDDGQEEEDVDEQGVRREQGIAFAVHQPMTSRRSERMTASEATMVAAMSRNPMAAPAGQSRALRNWIWMILAMVVVSAPPSRSGVTKSPMAGMKVRIEAATMPGMVSGRVTWMNARATAGVEVACGGDQRVIQAVDGDEERQDGEGQEAVGHAQHDRQVGVEQDDRLVDQAGGLEQ